MRNIKNKLATLALLAVSTLAVSAADPAPETVIAGKITGVMDVLQPVAYIVLGAIIVLSAVKKWGKKAV